MSLLKLNNTNETNGNCIIDPAGSAESAPRQKENTPNSSKVLKGAIRKIVLVKGTFQAFTSPTMVALENLNPDPIPRELMQLSEEIFNFIYAIGKQVKFIKRWHQTPAVAIPAYLIKAAENEDRPVELHLFLIINIHKQHQAITHFEANSHLSQFHSMAINGFNSPEMMKKLKLEKISSFPQWMEAFIVYVCIATKSKPHLIKPMLVYARITAYLVPRWKWAQIEAYDMAFRNKVASEKFSWDTTHPKCYANYFYGHLIKDRGKL
jgi:hypothetical protein